MPGELRDSRIAGGNGRVSRKDRQSLLFVDEREPGNFPLKHSGQQLLAGHIIELLFLWQRQKFNVDQYWSQGADGQPASRAISQSSISSSAPWWKDRHSERRAIGKRRLVQVPPAAEGVGDILSSVQHQHCAEQPNAVPRRQLHPAGVTARHELRKARRGAREGVRDQLPELTTAAGHKAGSPLQVIKQQAAEI